MAEALIGEAAMNAEHEITDAESTKYSIHDDDATKFPSWIKVTAVAAASVLAGGLAAAWIYRKSIARLQNPESMPEYSNSSISGGEADDEI